MLIQGKKKKYFATLIIEDFIFYFFVPLQGGRHVDYVVDQVVGKLIEVVKKKNKAGVSVKPFQVSGALHILLNY